MVDANPRAVLDLGCGQGALSKAAVGRWGDSFQLTTLDIDSSTASKTSPWASRHSHILCDLLEIGDLSSMTGRKRFDVAVLNPPYGRRAPSTTIETRNHKEPLAWQSIRCRSTLFIIHALTAVRFNGLVAAIIPETLAIGMGYRANRRLISSYSKVERVAALPAGTFAGTEARTAMVVFRRIKFGTSKSDPWYSRESLDWQSSVPSRSPSTIGELGVEVTRGRLSTSEARNAGGFHLDTFKSARDGFICLPEKHHHHDDRAANAGDILVARIGRNISEKVVRVSTGSNVISDCVYRLRCPPAVVERVWNGLRSDAGKRQMEASLSGVTTRLLPMGNLLALNV
jgi:type I restriction enzyme M protein